MLFLAHIKSKDGNVQTDLREHLLSSTTTDVSHLEEQNQLIFGLTKED